ncbi:pyridoxal phosphate-dependent aminotransferase [Dactylosporangium matsuzakiense]|uniref:pyridoxal phosphate-dependent aminotransferase n=1 Tax=Dactylosporangium matsuzakiense TaxID=53360 RepID=UPI0022F2A53C|nr:pyridoxal phosphate-dependent aminotransferase [Dactylosporangium matsuzakiense]
MPALTLRELVPGPSAFADLGRLSLGYPPAVGSRRLRELVGEWVGGTAASRVLITAGAAEALSIVVGALVAPGDEIVVIEPGYRHVRGLAENAGAVVSAVRLRPERQWRLDLGEIEEAVGPGVRVISVNNPANPLGTVLSEQEMTGLVRIAERRGAWIVADEVYRGSERDGGPVTLSFAGMYDRAVCIGSLSKAFGLPGLRIGWVAAEPEVLASACRRHEYAAIAASAVSIALAESALEQPRRDELIERGRTFIRAGYDRLSRWVDASGGLLSVVPPDAAAMAFVRYHADVASVDLADAIRTGARTLVCAGDYFGGPRHLRIQHTVAPEVLDAVMPGIIEIVGRYAA